MKKLNNKGFGFAAFIVFIFVFIIAIIIIAILTNSTKLSPDNNNNLNQDNANEIIYKNYERNISEAAMIYYNDNLMNILDGESAIIAIEKLSLSDKILNSCTGYVRIMNESEKMSYQSYLSCGSYTTSGYVPSLDN